MVSVKINLVTQEIYFVDLIIELWQQIIKKMNKCDKIINEKNEDSFQVNKIKPCQWCVSELCVKPFLP